MKGRIIEMKVKETKDYRYEFWDINDYNTKETLVKLKKSKSIFEKAAVEKVYLGEEAVKIFEAID